MVKVPAGAIVWVSEQGRYCIAYREREPDGCYCPDEAINLLRKLGIEVTPSNHWPNIAVGCFYATFLHEAEMPKLHPAVFDHMENEDFLQNLKSL